MQFLIRDEAEELAQDVVQALDLVLEPVEPLIVPPAHIIVGQLEVLGQKLKVQPDRGQGVLDLVGQAAGKAADLTGCSYQAMVRGSYSDDTPLAQFVVDTGTLALGTIPITLPAAITSQLAGKVGVWDLRQTDASGLVVDDIDLEDRIDARDEG